MATRKHGNDSVIAKISGEWCSTWQTNSEGEHPWSLEKVVIAGDDRAVTLKNSENDNGYQWEAVGTVNKESSLSGSWHSTKPGATSAGAFMLNIVNQGDHIVGFFLGPNRRGYWNYGAWILAKSKEDLTAGKKALAETCPGLVEIMPRADHTSLHELFHAQLADKVWSTFMRQDYDTAVFQAFKQVEIAVRKAAGLQSTDLGVNLMRDAFRKATGPLTDGTLPEPEQDALAHFFAGAIGLYKNPHSHRHVPITDDKEALEMIVIASHLLRIVAARDKESGE